MNKVGITPAVKGALTQSDLLLSEGTLTFEFRRADLEEGGRIFEAIGEGFSFVFGSNGKNIFVKRNEALLELAFDKFSKNSSMLLVFLAWSHNKLTLFCGGRDMKKDAELPTIPCNPPTSLIRWARMQNLVPVIEYENEEKFREKSYACLNSIQQKIEETGAIYSFWDFQYSRKKIISRSPKKELDIHPLAHSWLSDQMLMSGIEVIPEYKTGVGNLDFMFLGNIKHKTSSRLCVEFKNAHSEDIFHGLEKQLPSYMRNKGSNYGAYCVLSYKGEWFDKPNMSIHELEMAFSKSKIESSDPLVKEGIRVFVYDLSKRKTASKK